MALKIQIKETSETLISKNSTVLPILKSNNLAFEIFTFIDQPSATSIFRIVSRKGLEKAKFLHLYARQLIIFKVNMMDFDLIYELKIGVLMRNHELETFS